MTEYALGALEERALEALRPGRPAERRRDAVSDVGELPTIIRRAEVAGAAARLERFAPSEPSLARSRR